MCTAKSQTHSRNKWIIGDIAFSLEGGGPVYDYLAEEFSALPQPEENLKCYLEIILVDVLPDYPEGAVIAKHFIGWECGFQYISNHLRYQLVEKEGGYILALDCGANAHRNRLFGGVLQFLDWNYLSAPQVLAKSFMYSCFNLITGILHAKRGAACYLHASSFEKSGFGVALAACGGVGKTTSMLRLVVRNGWRYLSDDVALIDSAGNLIRTPLRIQVYGYNVAGEAELSRRLLRSRRLLDRISWHVRLLRKGPNRTRRRVSAEDLFGPASVSSIAPCRVVVFMERANIKDASITGLPKSDLIDRMACIMPSEIGGLNELSEGLRLVGCNLEGFNRDEYQRAYKEVLNSALASCSVFLLKIPRRYSPAELSNYIKDFLKGEHASFETSHMCFQAK